MKTRTMTVVAACVALTLAACKSPAREHSDDLVDRAKEHEETAKELREEARRDRDSDNSAMDDLKEDIKREMREELEANERRK